MSEVMITKKSETLHSEHFPPIHWGAILAGIVVGLATQLVLMSLGLAAGLSVADANDTGEGVTNVSGWAMAWQGLSMLISAFVGGYVASRMSGLKRKTDGAMHGCVAWGATTLLFVVLSMSAAGSVLGGLFYNVTSNHTQTSARAAGPARGEALASGLRGILQQRQSGVDVSRVSVTDLQSLQNRIEAGDRPGAIRFMTQTMGITQGAAERIIDQALMLTGSSNAVPADARAQAKDTLRTAETASWSVFYAIVLSLLVGIGGGLVGTMLNNRRLPYNNSGGVNTPNMGT